jgi:hypothetical protein
MLGLLFRPVGISVDRDKFVNQHAKYGCSIDRSKFDQYTDEYQRVGPSAS